MSSSANLLKTPCVICDMGSADYGNTLELQKKLHAMRVNGEIPDTLLLVEHTPTMTIGKSGSAKNILVSPEKLTKMGISLFFVERGGDVTYHGPGQLVAYPIIDLAKRGKDIRAFVNDLEEIMIWTAKDFSVIADRDPGHRGIWIMNKELGAIGISVRKWVTMHGLALNVSTNLNHFEIINPCGFTDRQATSLIACANKDVSMESVRNSLKLHFSYVFDVDFIQITPEKLQCMVSQ